MTMKTDDNAAGRRTGGETKKEGLTVINVFGGPGSGRATTEMCILAALKTSGRKVDTLANYAKEAFLNMNYKLRPDGGNRGEEMRRHEAAAWKAERLKMMDEAGFEFAVTSEPAAADGPDGMELHEFRKSLNLVMEQPVPMRMIWGPPAGVECVEVGPDGAASLVLAMVAAMEDRDALEDVAAEASCPAKSQRKL